MDYIRIVGIVIFVIGIIIEIFNTKWKWPFWKGNLGIRSKKASIISTIFIVIGFIIVIARLIYFRRMGT